MVVPFSELETRGRGGDGLGRAWDSSSAWEADGKFEAPLDAQVEQRLMGLR